MTWRAPEWFTGQLAPLFGLSQFLVHLVKFCFLLPLFIKQKNHISEILLINLRFNPLAPVFAMGINDRFELAGDGTFPGPGIEAVVISGAIAAGLIDSGRASTPSI